MNEKLKVTLGKGETIHITLESENGARVRQIARWLVAACANGSLEAHNDEIEEAKMLRTDRAKRGSLAARASAPLRRKRREEKKPSRR